MRREKRGLRKSYLCFSVSERLRCRISFISYWCYFVLSGLLSACKGIWEHLREDMCLFNMWVGMCRCEITWCVCVWCSCFRQYICSPTGHSPSPSKSPASFAVCVRNCPIKVRVPNLLLCRDIFVFFNLFSSATSPVWHRGLYGNFLNHLLIVVFVVMVFKLKSLLIMLHCFYPSKIQMHKRRDRAQWWQHASTVQSHRNYIWTKYQL